NAIITRINATGFRVIAAEIQQALVQIGQKLFGLLKTINPAVDFRNTDFNLRRLVFLGIGTERSAASVQCLLRRLGSRRRGTASNSEISLQHLSGGAVQTTEGKLSVMVQIQLPLQRPLLLHHLRQPLWFA